MRSYQETLRNVPSVDPASYRDLRRAQFARTLPRIFFRIRLQYLLTVSGVRRTLTAASRTAHRQILLFLLSLSGNLIPNTHGTVARRTKHGRYLVPEGMTVAEAAGPVRSVPTVLWHRLLGGARTFRMGRMGTLAFAVVLMVLIAMTNFFNIAVHVSIGPRDLGVVENETVFAEAVTLAENQARRCLGQLYTLDLVPHYSISMARSDELLSAEEMADRLFEQINEAQALYTFSVNGEIIGAVADRSLVDQWMENTVAAAQSDEPEAEVGFAEEITFELKTVSVKYYMEPSELIKELSGNRREAQSYTMAKGDSLSQIALLNNMTLTELLALNEGLDADALQPGDEILLAHSIPMLSLAIRKLETYDEAIPFPVQEVEDKGLYVNTTRVKQNGVNGLRNVTAYRTYQNGELVKTEEISSTVLKEAVPKIVRVGVRKRGTAATGEFQWPCSGMITSEFGNRPKFKDFHTGLDIGNRANTPIYAADGGKVVIVKYLNYSYGHYVKIDHENGFATIYAHCNDILVSEGDRVAKGQLIAYMGETGRAYGNHCHFEIIKNGQQVDPRDYVK